MAKRLSEPKRKIKFKNPSSLRKISEIFKRFHILFEHTRDIILFVGQDGDILEANNTATAAYGYRKEDLLTMSIFDICDAESGLSSQGQLELMSSEGEVFESTHRRRDGSIFPVEISSQITKMYNQPIIVIIIKDITFSIEIY